jgi:TrmH family RNA methyltransferase
MAVLRSRDNPRLRRWRRLAADAAARRRERSALIEGPHLVAACLESGGRPRALIVSESAAARSEIARLVAQAGAPATVLSDSLFGALSGAETPQGIAAEIALPGGAPALAQAAACVFLDGVQDAGNVGAILRSAAAFGVPAAVLGPGCADAWSPKVLRAGMGAHFALALGRSRELAADIAAFGGPVACAVPRGGVPLREADLPARVGWIFGAEGRGVSAPLAALAALRVTIPLAPGAESLNVAAAAAICLYEAASRRAARSAARA